MVADPLPPPPEESVPDMPDSVVTYVGDLPIRHTFYYEAKWVDRGDGTHEWRWLRDTEDLTHLADRIKDLIAGMDEFIDNFKAPKDVRSVTRTDWGPDWQEEVGVIEADHNHVFFGLFPTENYEGTLEDLVLAYLKLLKMFILTRLTTITITESNAYLDMIREGVGFVPIAAAWSATLWVSQAWVRLAKSEDPADRSSATAILLHELVHLFDNTLRWTMSSNHDWWERHAECESALAYMARGILERPPDISHAQFQEFCDLDDWYTEYRAPYIQSTWMYTFPASNTDQGLINQAQIPCVSHIWAFTYHLQQTEDISTTYLVAWGVWEAFHGCLGASKFATVLLILAIMPIVEVMILAVVVLAASLVPILPFMLPLLATLIGTLGPLLTPFVLGVIIETGSRIDYGLDTGEGHMDDEA